MFFGGLASSQKIFSEKIFFVPYVRHRWGPLVLQVPDPAPTPPGHPPRPFPRHFFPGQEYKRMSESKTSDKASWWSITINNPTNDQRVALCHPPPWVKNLSYQDEIAPTTGTLHVQGCLNTDSVRFSAIKSWLKTAHIEACYKSAAALQNYCKKTETSVDGTYIEFHRDVPETNTIAEPPVSDNVLEMLLTLGRANNLPSETPPDESYGVLVRHLCYEYPQLTTKLTASRILPAWRILNLEFTKLAEEAELSYEYPEHQDTGHRTYQIIDLPDLVDCPHCGKDECQQLEQNYPYWSCQDIISLA